MADGRETGRVLMTADWVVGHENGRHVLLPRGEVVFEDGAILFAGHGFEGEVARRIDCGRALIGPGFVDLDALSDLDTTVLGFDNQPAWKKGRVWPESYMQAGPREMYTPEDLRWQKRYAFTRLIRNGITTALPIASLFYREWGETWDEFAGAAEAARELGLRVYLGPAYRGGNTYVTDAGEIAFHFDEDRGLMGLTEAIRFCETFENTGGGLIRTMLAPDRIETCTAPLLSRTGRAVRDLDVPVRLHCCQSAFEYHSVVRMHGKSPPQWLRDLGFLSPRAILPHLTFLSGLNDIDHHAPDLEILAESGAALAHCPLVMARGGTALRSFARYRDAGMTIGMGTDTHPPDMVLNMQVGLMTARIADRDPQAVRASDLYDAATLGGARALGRDDLGRLAPGARADITVIGLDDPAMGQVLDPIQTLLLSGSGRDVRTVVIDGRIVMRDGVIPGVDHAALRDGAQARFDGLVAQYPDRTFGHPPVEEIFAWTYPVKRASV
ncbi:amidohydrolase family protein [Aestuariicoccus sp. MJ-SS9]|uniref:amidohydrolase family protein n=1 Tax=Aestuariicoccus sp. MJ-SS9 TaxID=3079855 RepID=UPI0029092CF5|nr:amidohydrolase family protein [Aestuariicoccus sp. MJ-SS9]MDU8913922.1 amidohydrolase family protein [Aestuariicoccus sp. MJ-SS9]